MAVVPAKRAGLRPASEEPGPSIPETEVFARLLSAPAVRPSRFGDYWIPALGPRGEPRSLGRNDNRGCGDIAEQIRHLRLPHHWGRGRGERVPKTANPLARAGLSATQRPRSHWKDLMTLSRRSLLATLAAAP